MKNWKPSASQRREFANNMQDPEYREAYETRKTANVEKRRQSSKYDYASAGGQYMPTEIQYNAAMELMASGTMQQQDAARMVIYGFTCSEKVDHDHIHIINEYIRSK